MPSTVYKGDLAEVTFGRETGIVLSHGHFGGLAFSVDNSSTDVSTITLSRADTSSIATDADLVTNNATITVASTTGLYVGMTLAKASGAGAFGANPTITSVDSATQITASVNHATAGAITFSATHNSTSTADWFVGSSSNLKYPKGLLAGCTLRVKGGTNYVGDDLTRGRMYKVVDNYGAVIKVTPKMVSVGASGAADELIVDNLATPTLDGGMAYAANADASDETVYTDQFIGLAATVTLPETKVEVFRSHVVGIGRDVVGQEPQHIDNEGGSIETMMHSARWLYYALGNEAVKPPASASAGTTVKETIGTVESKAIAMGDTYVEFGAGTATNFPLVNEYILIEDSTEVLTPHDNTMLDGIATLTVTAGGAGYAENDTITLTNPRDGVQAIVTKSNVGTGALSTLTVTTAGASYKVGDRLTQTATSGSGTGVILTVATLGAASSDRVKWTGTQTQFHSSIRSEMRRVIAVDQTVTASKRVYVDGPFNFDHGSDKNIRVLAADDMAANGSPHFDTAEASFGNISNRQSRALWSMWHTPSFSLETSMRTRNVESYGTGAYAGSQLSNTPDSANDSKQLTRVYKGCKVKNWELTADADAQVKMKVDFDALMCYTDTGRLEAAANNGDRFTAHRMFENIANGPKERKVAGIAPNTEKPFFYYNGTITGFGTTIAQITNFKLTGNNNTTTLLTVGANPLAESRNTSAGDGNYGKSLEQIPFAGSRNPSLNIEGRVEYELDMEILPLDPLLWHEYRSNREHGYPEPITLHLIKNGAGAEREEVYIIIDDYIIKEASLQIPDDKTQIKMPLKILPKHVKVVAHDAMFNC